MTNNNPTYQQLTQVFTHSELQLIYWVFTTWEEGREGQAYRDYNALFDLACETAGETHVTSKIANAFSRANETVLLPVPWTTGISAPIPETKVIK